MTNEEIIELQKKDIATLQAQRKFLAEQIVRLQSQPKVKVAGARDYEFDVPYFRLTTYEIVCYRVVSIVDYKWNKNSEVNTEYRFSDIFGFNLYSNNFGAARRGCYGNRRFTTCISYDELMKKLKRRVASNYKNKGNEWNKIIDGINQQILYNKDCFRDDVLPVVPVTMEEN